MRIRKNAKLSPLLFSSMASLPEVLQTHVCQLNQSPWDVIPFTQDQNQFETEDSFTGNGSFGDSIGAVESVASMMEGSAKLSNSIVISNDNEEMADKDGNCEETLDDKVIEFKKFAGRNINRDDDDDDGDGRNEDYYSLNRDNRCSLNRSSEVSVVQNEYSLNNCSIITKRAAAGTTASRRPRPSRASKKAAVVGSNPYEFYYYSGFGPLWGKKRRERGEDGGNGKIIGKSMENMNEIQKNSSTPSSSLIDYDELFDYDDGDEEEEDEEEGDGGDGDGGKRRMRKPVKARSLKSLM